MPTGTVTETEAEFDSETDFLRFLNRWNREGNGVYQYTSTDVIATKGHAGQNFRNRITISQKRDISTVFAEGGYWTPHNIKRHTDALSITS